MNNILVIPSSIKNLLEVVELPIKGVILGIKDLSINSNIYFDIDSLKEIIPKLKNKTIFISLNKIMHNNDLSNLETILIELNKIGLNNILFYDIAVLNISTRLNLNNNLVIYQDHLNASVSSNLFYKKRGINTTYITNDITIEEINEIKIQTGMKVIYQIYGNISMFYSRRELLTNYFKYIMKDKTDNIYYLKHEDGYYPIKEEETGTSIFSKKIDLTNHIKELVNIDYLVINSLDSSDNEIIKIINKIINQNIDNEINYEGFFNTKTIYKIKSTVNKNE